MGWCLCLVWCDLRDGLVSLSCWCDLRDGLVSLSSLVGS